MLLARTLLLVNRKPEAVKRLETEVKKAGIDPYVKGELEKLLADVVLRE